MLDPLLYRWGVPPVVIRCVHWTMQMGVLLTWIMAQSTAIVMHANGGASHSQSASKNFIMLFDNLCFIFFIVNLFVYLF